MARNNNKISCKFLPPAHHYVFTATLRRILQTSLAKTAYAQLLDGTPNAESYGEDHYQRYRWCRTQTSPEAFEILEMALSRFSPNELVFDSKVVQDFQNTHPGTASFNRQLLEMIVIACHDLGTRIVEVSGGGLHPVAPDAFMRRDPELRPSRLPPEVLATLVRPREDMPTIFYHPGYENWTEYPHGVADCAGYWVESQIFGGGVAFDRGESGKECNGVYIDRSLGWKMFELSDRQLWDFFNFGMHKVEDCPLPFRAEEQTQRICQWDALELNIFRDRYERKPPNTLTRPCVVRGNDYAGLLQSSRAFQSRDRHRHPGAALDGKPSTIDILMSRNSLE